MLKMIIIMYIVQVIEKPVWVEIVMWIALCIEVWKTIVRCRSFIEGFREGIINGK